MCHSPQTAFPIHPFPSLVEFLPHSSIPVCSLCCFPVSRCIQSVISSLHFLLYRHPSASSSHQPSKPPSSLSFSLPVPSTPFSVPLLLQPSPSQHAHTFPGVWPQKLNFWCRKSPCGLMKADNINEAIASIHN